MEGMIAIKQRFYRKMWGISSVIAMLVKQYLDVPVRVKFVYIWVRVGLWVCLGILLLWALNWRVNL